MGDNAEHRDGRPSDASGDDKVNDPLGQTDVKAARAEFDDRKPE